MTTQPTIQNSVEPGAPVETNITETSPSPPVEIFDVHKSPSDSESSLHYSTDFPPEASDVTSTVKPPLKDDHDEASIEQDQEPGTTSKAQTEPCAFSASTPTPDVLSASTLTLDAFSTPTPGAYSAPTPEAYPGNPTADLYLFQGVSVPTPGNTNPPYSVSTDLTYIPVPTTPFPFSSLPLIPRITVLQWYLESIGTTGSRSLCDCLRTSKKSWTTRDLTPDDPCYNLHQQFGYHAKFLPLLLTNRQMHDEFRPRRYAHGIFHIIPVNNVRSGLLRDWERASFVSIFSQKLDGDPLVSHLTPFPENVQSRNASFVRAPLLPFAQIPDALWQEIKTVQLKMEFSYFTEWQAVRQEFELLVTMLKTRYSKLNKLTVELGWSRVTDIPDHVANALGVRQVGEFWDIWRAMMKPLQEVDWKKEGAREVRFRGRDWWDGDADVDAGEDDNGEQRTFWCENFEEFEGGIAEAKRKDRLEVEYWHCGC